MKLVSALQTDMPANVNAQVWMTCRQVVTKAVTERNMVSHSLHPVAMMAATRRLLRDAKVMEANPPTRAGGFDAAARQQLIVLGARLVSGTSAGQAWSAWPDPSCTSRGVAEPLTSGWQNFPASTFGTMRSSNIETARAVSLFTVSNDSSGSIYDEEAGRYKKSSRETRVSTEGGLKTVQEVWRESLGERRPKRYFKLRLAFVV
ncbi:hypothetical protein P389DRAFT_166184 [Cystobasidium minutum MCA 4210]|uniref:uncharacterized protein n=1 Tax=Cystobasidium minutum MCA 4210 TaxID=1397322 RepID=UPI0034CD76E7|eukprot:jgi/Rhomi1/166184/fgenesh1_kg.1_\